LIIAESIPQSPFERHKAKNRKKSPSNLQVPSEGCCPMAISRAKSSFGFYCHIEGPDPFAFAQQLLIEML
jgi:hypothetical protein